MTRFRRGDKSQADGGQPQTSQAYKGRRRTGQVLNRRQVGALAQVGVQLPGTLMPRRRSALSTVRRQHLHYDCSIGNVFVDKTVWGNLHVRSTRCQGGHKGKAQQAFHVGTPGGWTVRPPTCGVHSGRMVRPPTVLTNGQVVGRYALLPGHILYKVDAA